MSERKTTCFVIMPFSKSSDEHTKEYWTKHFNSFLKPLIEEHPKVRAHRSKPLRGDVLRKIITDLVTSPIVVADLTDLNPNVYWELGVRQSFKHGTITIAERGTSVPFDISVRGVLSYCDNHLENADFTRDFKEAINDVLSSPDTPDSHVLETISGRGSLFQIIQRDEAIRRLDALLSECRENEVTLATIRKVLADEKRSRIPAGRMRTSAVELLVTHRYVDKPPQFYSTAENYFDSIQAVNSHLEMWPVNVEGVDEWFKTNAGTIETQLGSLKTAVLACRSELIAQL